MGETPRRSAFRLPWTESGEQEPEQPANEPATAPVQGTVTGEAVPAGNEGQSTAAPAPADAAQANGEANPFLRELVDAMRGVAESSRDATLSELHATLDERVEAMRSAAAERAEDLRRRSDHDVTAIGEWERTEIERVRSEAEQRRDARRAKLERELADHQAASDREMEAAQHKLSDYERELSAFFAELAEIQDPTAYVAAAKRMPAPPDLASANDDPRPATGPEANGTASAPQSEMTLSQRLAELDQQLASAPTEPVEAGTPAEPSAGAEPATPPEAAAPAEPAAAEVPQPAAEVSQAAGEAAETPQPAAEVSQPAAEEAKEPAIAAATAESEPAAASPPPAPAQQAAAADALTPIVVKGLGSFGAITSFKQALERVDGVNGVTLSLGPTGEFVYRASHGPEFDIVAAIRQIEGPGAGIEQSEGQVLVTIERQR